MTASSQTTVSVIGGGLAGTECAYQLARLGHHVTLLEQKPIRRSPAHVSSSLAELVCSNSFRSDNPQSAIGLLHEELRRVGSGILKSADLARVPAGDALAVEREGFSREVQARLQETGRVEVRAGEVTAIPEGPVVIATGPLTSEGLTQTLSTWTGTKLYFYDAIAPIVSDDSIDHSIAFRMSRYGKGGGDDYLNLPMNRDEYTAFVAAVREAEKVTPHAFEEPKYFEGCLPIEVMASRGDDVLAFGPMKPVGLTDPRTGKRPHAVVQLRMEDRAGSAWNLVGFQTRMTWPAQKRVFSMIPGLKNAEWLRMGQIHRNTFIDSPRLLSRDLSLKVEPRVWFAGQITGVEGYVESAACGYLVALAVHARLTGKTFAPPPQTTALGALYAHLTGDAHPPDAPHQPTNVVFALFPPLEARLKKADKRLHYMLRGRDALTAWAPSAPHDVLPPPVPVPATATPSATAGATPSAMAVSTPSATSAATTAGATTAGATTPAVATPVVSSPSTATSVAPSPAAGIQELRT